MLLEVVHPLIRICACFLENGLRILDGWEEMHPILLMSFVKDFFNSLHLCALSVTHSFLTESDL